MEGDGGWHYGGHGYNNWDLDAVVRLGGGGGNAALEPFQDDPIFALLQPQQDVLPGALPPPQQDVMPDALPQQQQGVLPDANPWQELQGAMDLPMAADPAFADLDAFLSDPVFAAPQSPPPPSPRNEAPAPQQAPAAEPPALGKAAAEPSSDAGAGSSRPKHARRSRKDMEAKYVVTVPAPYLPSSDKWSWRKYGQKPIKGSPFPRGYYKCTSNKDCPARKQVEQSSSDPNTLIVSYTGEHCHSPPTNRNSRAGIMRSSSRTPVAAGGGGSASQPAAPQLVLPAPAAAAPPPAPPRSVYMDFGKDDDDALALQALIDDAVLAPENAFLFLNPDYVAPPPVNAAGGEGNQPLPIPLENMATDVSRGTGSGTDGCQAPIPTNVAMDCFFGSPWEAAWPEAAPGPWGM